MKLQYAVLQRMAMNFAQGKENLSAPRKPSLDFLQHYSQQLNMAFYIHLKGSFANCLTLHSILFNYRCRVVFSDRRKPKIHPSPQKPVTFEKTYLWKCTQKDYFCTAFLVSALSTIIRNQVLGFIWNHNHEKWRMTFLCSHWPLHLVIQNFLVIMIAYFKVTHLVLPLPPFVSLLPR